MRILGHIVIAFGLVGLSACASDDVGVLPKPRPLERPSFFETTLPPVVGRAVPGGPAQAPSGYIAFCARLPAQCSTSDDAPSHVTLTDEVRQTLQEVNLVFNRVIKAQDDRIHYNIEEFWTIPIDGYGDCDDYVVVKREALKQLGLPAPALRIAVVFTSRFVRHAVLTVVTDQGNYVLDNLRDEIVTWDKTGYTFIEQQDPQSPTGWVSLE